MVLPQTAIAISTVTPYVSSASLH